MADRMRHDLLYTEIYHLYIEILFSAVELIHEWAFIFVTALNSKGFARSNFKKFKI